MIDRFYSDSVRQWSRIRALPRWRRGGGARWACLAWLACLSGAWAAPGASVAERPAVDGCRVRATEKLMGVPWTITVHAAVEGAGNAAVAAAFAEVGRLERILSDYDPASELSRLSAAAPTATPLPVGPDLWAVLVRAVAIRDASGGAFDPTVGPLTTLWRQARRSGRMPADERLAAARAAVGPGTLVLVPEARSVTLARPGMRLDLGGIGMGYAADRALEVLERHGITAAMIDASGDVLVSGPPPGTAGWRIAVAPLRRRDGAGGKAGGMATGGRPPADDAGGDIVIAHAAVTTSGDAFQGVEIEGRRYSHIVDPRTGLGVAGPAAVTVIARDGTTADAAATAASVLGPEASAPFLTAAGGCAARFVWLDGATVRTAILGPWPPQVSQTAR